MEIAHGGQYHGDLFCAGAMVRVHIGLPSTTRRCFPHQKG